MNFEFLRSIGWNEFFQKSFDSLGDPNGDLNFEAARVIGQSRGHYQVLIAADTSIDAAITSKLHKAARSNSAGFPTVGDWVAIQREQGKQQSSIHSILERKSLIQRKRSGGRNEMQLIAANIDHMLIVTSMNEDFDLARLGRYVSLAKDSGCAPALVLTKADLCPSSEDYVDKAKAKFASLEVFAISNAFPDSITSLEKFFSHGKTTVLVGSSGVGKSTLTNYLLGNESQKTQGVSAASRGKHTTTTRDLRITRFGGLVIDTPGMQEIVDLTDAEDISAKFAAIEALELQCKFTNCQHQNEPGCAIKRAIKNGELTEAKWNEFLSAKNHISLTKRR